MEADLKEEPVPPKGKGKSGKQGPPQGKPSDPAHPGKGGQSMPKQKGAAAAPQAADQGPPAPPQTHAAKQAAASKEYAAGIRKQLERAMNAAKEEVASEQQKGREAAEAMRAAMRRERSARGTSRISAMKRR